MAPGPASLRLSLLVATFCVVTLGTSRAADFQSFLQPASQNWPGADLWGTLLYTVRTFEERRVRGDSVDTKYNDTVSSGRLELDTEDDLKDEVHQGPSARDRAIGAALGPYITPIADPGISKACQQASEAYANNIMKKQWALKMFDATGKLPDGILEGNINLFGNWDECLNITAVFNATDIGGQDPVIDNFSGKYCYTFIINAGQEPHNIQSLKPVPPTRGVGLAPVFPDLPMMEGQAVCNAICMPSVCSAQELSDGVNAAFKGKAFLYAVEDNCFTKDKSTELSSGAIVMIVILGLCGLFMIVGTVIDLLDTYAQEAPESLWFSLNAIVNRCSTLTLRRVFRAFSVYTNGRKLLNTSSTGDTLNCLHGIRFLSNTWVILGHSYLLVTFFQHRNIAAIGSFFNSVAFRVVTNASVSVDSFFMLSGLLVAYGFMRQMERTQGKFNIVMFYVHRYIRLTPVMMLVIGFIATLYMHLGSGPAWKVASHGNDPEVCQDYWWTNMLYVNNFLHGDNLCLPQSWYLANDMQMFIFSPLVLLPLWYYPTFGQLWIIFLVCFFTGINAMITAVHRIGLPGGDDENLRYQRPWCRAGAYLVGIYTGWVLSKIRHRKIQMPSSVVVLGWLTSSLTACLILYGGYGLPSPPPKSENIIYAMLNRTAWATCLAWVVFACVTGYGGVINSILSWKAFIPLSRLTYTSYLVHIDIQMFYWATNKMPVYLDQTFVVYMFLGSLPIIFAVALVFSLALESPMIALEKIIFSQPRPASCLSQPLIEETQINRAESRHGGAANVAFEPDADKCNQCDGDKNSVSDGVKSDLSPLDFSITESSA